MMRPIFESAPRIGLVIGTFAAVPYVHLQLESWQRNYPHIPMLVNDDASPFTAQLSAVCARYNVDFRSNAERMRRTVGDLSTYVHGLDWAAKRGIQLLVKFSRRFIPFYNWVPDLQNVACQSQMATYSQVCNHFKFGFRTECIAFHCESWRQSGGYDQMRDLVQRNQPVFVEGFLHQLARDIAKRLPCEAAVEYMRANPRSGDRNGYAVWDIMLDKRTTKRPDVLWHDCDAPFDYHRAAALYGLNYTTKDFQDPNQGCGLGRS